MKKFMLLAASALLLAGMMVSCEPRENEKLTSFSSFVKKDIQTLPDKLIGVSEKEAGKILTKAGFEADEDDPLEFSRKIVNDYREDVVLYSADGVICGFELDWKNINGEYEVLMEALEEALTLVYDKETYPNTDARLYADSDRRNYAEGKYVAELEKEETKVFGDYAAFLAQLKVTTFESDIYVNGEFTDDEACDYFLEYSPEDNGLFKAIVGQVQDKRWCDLMFQCAKNHLEMLD